MRVYVSGKYTAATAEERDRNVAVARDAAQALLRLGHAPFCPHTMCHGWENDGHFTDEQFLAMDFAWIEVCDALLMLPGWQDSPGGVREHAFALSRGTPVYHDLAQVPAAEERAAS